MKSLHNFSTKHKASVLQYFPQAGSLLSCSQCVFYGIAVQKLNKNTELYCKKLNCGYSICMNDPETVFLINLPDGAHPCIVRRSERARKIRLCVRPDGEIQIILPLHASVESAKAFVESQKAWLVRTLRSLGIGTRNNSENIPFPPDFPQTMKLAFFEAEFKLRYQWRNVPWTAARLTLDDCCIYVTGNLLIPGAVKGALREMLKSATEHHLFPRLKELARIHGFLPGKLSVRIQKGRWGSCSGASGNISLNAMLMLVPPELADYVLIHELCHLREPNHSDRFWKEVAGIIPQWPVLRKRLDRYAKKLLKENW